MNPITRDYNGITINQQSQDGYINLNQMAEATGKRIDNWLRLNSTKELVAEFHRRQLYKPTSTTSDFQLTTPNSQSTSSDLRELNSDLVHFEGEPSSDLRKAPSDLRNVQPALITSELNVEFRPALPDLKRLNCASSMSAFCAISDDLIANFSMTSVRASL